MAAVPARYPLFRSHLEEGPPNPLSVIISCKPYVVDLRTAWKTSHSVSTQRKNALLTANVVTIGDTSKKFLGYGEVGMPPKNALAGYHADYDDVETYTRRVVVGMSPVLSPQAAAYLMAAEATGTAAFGVTSNLAVPGGKVSVTLLLMCLLWLHDEHHCTQGKHYIKCERFGRSGVEAALLDLLGHIMHIPSWALAEAWLGLVFSQKGSLIGSLFGTTNNPEGTTGELTPDNVIPLSAVTRLLNEVVGPFVSLAREAATHPIGSLDHLKGYLTVGMASPEAMAAGVSEALTQTRFIKLKLDGDESLTYNRLTAIGKVLAERRDTAGVKSEALIVIDANASWTSEITRRFADNCDRMRLCLPPLVPSGGTNIDGNTALVPFSMADSSIDDEMIAAIYSLLGRAIELVEQPYPPDFAYNPDKNSMLPEWAETLAHCNKRGLKLFADESVCSAEDLPSLISYVNGINIKLEKCGGLLAAFEFVSAAQKVPSISFTWVGIMVGSRLLCNTAGQLLVRTRQGDVDGALLLTEESQLFTGGFEWMASSDGDGDHHGTILLQNAFGSGCDLKQ